MLKGRFGCVRERQNMLKSNTKVLKDDVDVLKSDNEEVIHLRAMEALKGVEKN